MHCPKLKAAVLAAAFVMSLSQLEAQDRSQGRSMVISRHGIVATEHPIASQIGATILSEGGNAIDAAIAANAAMRAHFMFCKVARVLRIDL